MTDNPDATRHPFPIRHNRGVTSDAFSSAIANNPIDLPDDEPCPCGAGDTYGACCGRFITGGQFPTTAEQCMRSRYTAYVLRHGDHLFRTWHPRTRPDQIDLENVTWTGLSINRTLHGGEHDTTGQVDFTAHWLLEDGHQADLHEVSTFEKRGRRWFYVEGDHHFHGVGGK